MFTRFIIRHLLTLSLLFRRAVYFYYAISYYHTMMQTMNTASRSLPPAPRRLLYTLLRIALILMPPSSQYDTGHRRDAL